MRAIVGGALLVIACGDNAATPPAVLPPLELELLAGDTCVSDAQDGVGMNACFASAEFLAVDGAGNLYVSDLHAIRKITPDLVVTTFAGSADEPGSADGNGTSARFFTPLGLAFDGAGNLYVADHGNCTIRAITPAGVVTTVAGNPGTCSDVDATGTAAAFDQPIGIAVDSASNVYVTEGITNKVRKISPGGVVTTFAGSGTWGYANGTGSAATFAFPNGIGVDSAGNVYVATQSTIRKITPSGDATTLAGSCPPDGTQCLGSADGAGAAASFSLPLGLAVDAAGNVYVADTGNETIRMITPTGVVTTIAGSVGQWGATDGLGSAARFNSPAGLAVGLSGELYIANYGSQTIRELRSGRVSTLPGGPQYGSTDGAGSLARFSVGVVIDDDGAAVRGLAVDQNDTIYLADSSNSAIRAITPNGVVSTIAGAPFGEGYVDGDISVARFQWPAGIALDGNGNLYVTDPGNGAIREITPGGTVSTVALVYHRPIGVTADSLGVYFADDLNETIESVVGGTVQALAGSPGVAGAADGLGASARFSGPHGLARDVAGNLYVADTNNQIVRSITPDGVVTTLAGLAGVTGNADGVGAAARFDHPTDVAVDGAGNVYVADRDNGAIRKIAPDGLVTTIVGAGAAGIVLGSTPGLWKPTNLAVSGDSLVIMDTAALLVLRHGAR